MAPKALIYFHLGSSILYCRDEDNIEKSENPAGQAMEEARIKENNRKIRPLIFLSLAIVTPLGFLCKFYRGPGYGWFNDYGGGILYELFWCLAFFLIWPRKSGILPICAGVFIGTSILELLQLISHPALEYIRSNFVGRTLIGSSFSFLDIPHYLVGCIIAWGLMKAINH